MLPPENKKDRIFHEITNDETFSMIKFFLFIFVCYCNCCTLYNHEQHIYTTFYFYCCLIYFLFLHSLRSFRNHHINRWNNYGDVNSIKVNRDENRHQNSLTNTSIHLGITHFSQIFFYNLLRHSLHRLC